MKKALVYFRDILAGRLSETEDGYEFRYEATYLARPQAEPISLTLPLREEAYQSHVLFPFFDGLISHFKQCLPAWERKIDESFLSDEMKMDYKELIFKRINKLLDLKER